ncbi:hypothetical protein J1N35_007624 [Gossypium stocksii]|uniref:Uncharacterized protein n=1 Tax=Gossypium stocksii TaxID=47602 RepID=A0A9D3W6X9_9ROSI|nr:hypothetical protein J1N35_007624 [Gossypium stocksii]
MFDWFYKLKDGKDGFVKGNVCTLRIRTLVLTKARSAKEKRFCSSEIRDDIVFKDPFSTFIGINDNKSIFWALRFHGRIFFKALWLDIVSVLQPMENVVMVRWTIHGIPRVPWKSRGRFDGASEYKLDKKGKIYEH